MRRGHGLGQRGKDRAGSRTSRASKEKGSVGSDDSMLGEGAPAGEIDDVNASELDGRAKGGRSGERERPVRRGGADGRRAPRVATVSVSLLARQSISPGASSERPSVQVSAGRNLAHLCQLKLRP